MDTTAMFSLEGRRAIVTGSSRGIGRMMAEGLLRQGATVYLTSRKEEDVRATAEELSSLGTCVAIPADVSTVEGVQHLVAAYREHEDHLDILVNNAGAAWGAPFEEFPESGWDKVMNVNVKGPFFLVQATKDLLLAGAGKRDGAPAKVINVSSIDGLAVNPWDTFSYQASKAAMLHLTRKLGVHLAPEGIVVSGIAPGAFPSTMNKAARDHADEVAASVPARRVGVPEDMAGAAIYLASRAGDYVVGTTLVVDGAVSLARVGTAAAE